MTTLVQENALDDSAFLALCAAGFICESFEATFEDAGDGGPDLISFEAHDIWSLQLTPHSYHEVIVVNDMVVSSGVRGSGMYGPNEKPDWSF